MEKDMTAGWFDPAVMLIIVGFSNLAFFRFALLPHRFIGCGPSGNNACGFS